MGVVSACLPSLRPLVSVMFRGKTTILGIMGGGKGSGNTSSSTGSSRRIWANRLGGDSEGHFDRLTDAVDPQQRWGNDVLVQGGRPGDGVLSGDDISMRELYLPAGGIVVTEEVEVTSSDWIDYNHKVF